MKRWTKVLLGVAGTAVLLAGGTLVAKRGGDEGAPVRTVEVSRGDLVDKALAVGTIEPETEIEVKSKVSGVVQRTFAEVGDFVRAGEPLLEIRPDPTPLERVEARRQVEMREVALETLRRELERQQKLFDQGLLSGQEFDGVKQRYEEAKLQLQLARDRLQLVNEGRIESADAGVESVVRAPIDGYILERRVEIGDPVVPLTSYQAGTPLLTMADMNRLIFRGTVDEIDVGRLEEGMPAQITIGALPDATIRGTVSRIALKGKEEENATVFPVEITLAATGEVQLRAGFSANADIVIQERTDVLRIPERVVTFDDDSTWVRVRRPDGTVETRVIQTGLSDAIHVEVVSGLEEGEDVLEKPVKEI